MPRTMAYDRPMFATLHGTYPATDPGEQAADVESLIRRVLDDQREAGLGLLTDGGLRSGDPGALVLADLGGPDRPTRRGPLTVDAWIRTADAASGLPVKQCLPGPYTLGRRFAPTEDGRRDLTIALADALAAELADLAAAGCPFIQVDEDAAVSIGPDPTEQSRFVEAQARLLAGLEARGAPGRPHASLAIVGGSADAAGPETIFAPAYDSYLFDLVDGPDNWRLITRAPADRGIVLGVVGPGDAVTDAAVIVWAVGYAASNGNRGETRVGIATSGSLAALSRTDARRKIDLLGTVVGLIDRRHVEPIAASLDPRAVDSRSATLGRWTPPADRRPGSRG
jgi:Cobalamin-independent synthase, Catalytic domain